MSLEVFFVRSSLLLTIIRSISVFCDDWKIMFFTVVIATVIEIIRKMSPKTKS